MNSETTITFCTSIAAIALLSASGFILNQQVLAARESGNIGNVGHLYIVGINVYHTRFFMNNWNMGSG